MLNIRSYSRPRPVTHTPKHFLRSWSFLHLRCQKCFVAFLTWSNFKNHQATGSCLHSSNGTQQHLCSSIYVVHSTSEPNLLIAIAFNTRIEVEGDMETLKDIKTVPDLTIILIPKNGIVFKTKSDQEFCQRFLSDLRAFQTPAGSWLQERGWTCNISFYNGL